MHFLQVQGTHHKKAQLRCRAFFIDSRKNFFSNSLVTSSVAAQVIVDREGSEKIAVFDVRISTLSAWLELTCRRALRKLHSQVAGCCRQSLKVWIDCTHIVEIVGGSESIAQLYTDSGVLRQAKVEPNAQRRTPLNEGVWIGIISAWDVLSFGTKRLKGMPCAVKACFGVEVKKGHAEKHVGREVRLAEIFVSEVLVSEKLIHQHAARFHDVGFEVQVAELAAFVQGHVVRSSDLAILQRHPKTQVGEHVAIVPKLDSWPKQRVVELVSEIAIII